jgi:hypothetical protein
MLHKYYKKILSKVPSEKKSPSDNNDCGSPLKFSTLKVSIQAQARSGTAKKIIAKELKEEKSSPNSKSPANFSSYLKRSPLPINKTIEKALKISQDKLSEVSNSLFSLYETIFLSLRGDEVKNIEKIY